MTVCVRALSLFAFLKYQANKVPGRNVCGNGKCCRTFTEGKFQGSGSIVKPGLMALLTCTGRSTTFLPGPLSKARSQKQLLPGTAPVQASA